MGWNNPRAISDQTHITMNKWRGPIDQVSDMETKITGGKTRLCWSGEKAVLFYKWKWCICIWRRCKCWGNFDGLNYVDRRLWPVKTRSDRHPLRPRCSRTRTVCFCLVQRWLLHIVLSQRCCNGLFSTSGSHWGFSTDTPVPRKPDAVHLDRTVWQHMAMSDISPWRRMLLFRPTTNARTAY